MDAEPESLPTFSWTPPGGAPSRTPSGPPSGPPSGGADTGAEALASRCEELGEDRALAAAEVSRRAARHAHAWLAALGAERDAPGLDAVLDAALRPVWHTHGWRGPVGGLRAALRGAADGREAPRDALLEECALWCEDRSADEGARWDGTPLGPGARLPDRARVGAPFLSGLHALERGEVVATQGWSETVARTLEAAHAAGLAPEAIVSEGGPDLGGRRMARRLVAAGLSVRFVYDAALFDEVLAADRLWLGTDAIGAHGFIGRTGARALLKSAQRADVPTAVLATSDKLVPGGELELPLWCEDDAWLLWERPPSGVTVASQAFEIVPLEHAGVFATEFGLVTGAELSLRALRTA